MSRKKTPEFIVASRVIVTDLVDKGIVASTGDWIPLKAHGCFVHVTSWKNRDWLQSAPMNPDGTMEFSATDVTDPGSQEFLDAVNAIFGTRFALSDFGDYNESA